MAEDTPTTAPHVVSLSAREIPLPAALSDAARAMLSLNLPGDGPMPALDDHDAWRRLIAQRDAAGGAMRAPYLARLRADVEARELAGVPVYVGRPQGQRLLDERPVVFDIHGGALIFGGG